MSFQCYVFPLSKKLHPIPDLGFLKLMNYYDYSGKRKLQNGAKIVFAHTSNKSFIGETDTTSVTTKISNPNPKWNWKYRVNYDPNALFEYNPPISYIPYGKNVGVYPPLDISYYNTMIMGTSKIKI